MKSSDSLRQRARATVRRCGGQELARAAGWTHLELSTVARPGREIDADATVVMPANSAGKLAGSARRAAMCSTGRIAAAGEALCAVRSIGVRAGAPVAASSAQRGHRVHDVRCSAAISEHARGSAGAPTAGGRCGVSHTDCVRTRVKSRKIWVRRFPQDKRRPKTLEALWAAVQAAWKDDLTEDKIECAFRLL